MTTPYYADEQVTLYLGDCREVLPALGVTADCIVADPPYGETSLAWDRWPDGWLLNGREPLGAADELPGSAGSCQTCTRWNCSPGSSPRVGRSGRPGRWPT